MRYTFSFLLLLLSFNFVNAQGIQFFEGDLAAAKKAAKKDNKLIFIDSYTTWCGPCKWMAKNSFTDKEVGALFNDKFIPFKLDMEKGEGLDFAKEYNVQAYPTLVYIDSDGNLMHKQVGALNPAQLLQSGKDALNPDVRIGDIIIKYKAGERDPAFIRNYLLKANDAMIDAQEASDWYFYTQSEKDLLTKENVDLIIRLVKNPNNKAFKTIVNNQTEAQKLTEIPLDDYFDYVYNEYLSNAQRQGKEAFSLAAANLKASGYKNTDKIMAKMAFVSLLRADEKDWPTITKKIDRYFDIYAPKDAQLRNQLAWSYYTNKDIQDKGLLKTAAKWAKQSVDIEEGYANTDTYAALLYKIGNKKEAAIAAKKAIQLAKEEGQDAAETEALLEKINKL